MKPVPTATYRLQFREGMTFDRAVEIVPYLRRLGVSHLYASPIFTATSGSTHGYDVVDHNEIDPAIGGRDGFERLHGALRQAGLGMILDIVPNHMAASLENRWWRSVVEYGAESPYAGHFDIDWTDRLTLPILGRPFDEALAAGELALDVDAKHGCLVLSYFDNQLPLTPGTYGDIAARLGDASLGDLAGAAAEDRGGRAVHDSVRIFLASDAAAHLPEALAALSQDRTFVNRLHEAQPWRLTFWKEARRALSYRRFFEVTGLVGVRVEDDAVFDDVHRLVLSLVRDGLVDGLRVDHVDGLARPGAYLQRLREEVGPDVWLLVEKILGEGERLPPHWPDCGTTGYEFVPALADLLVDPVGAGALEAEYARFTGADTDIAAEERAAKLLILRRNFEGELQRIATLAAQLVPQPASQDLAPEEIERAIVEIVVGFDVYRTYGEGEELTPQDEARLAGALDAARRAGEAGDEALAFVAALLREGGRRGGQAAEFLTRFQQLTGPVTAKSVEDTLFYRVNPLIALNEVGATPGARAGDVERFHRVMQARLDAPLGLLATATHDTKRGEDARARLYALSEEPQLWREAVERWRSLNTPLRQTTDDGPVPDPQVEWLFYQMLAGMWPPAGAPDADALGQIVERVLAALQKSLREAKQRTDWLDMDESYESAVLDFARRALDLRNRTFLDDVDATLRPIVRAGALNALSQTLAKLTAPGVPDIYQGSERLDLSLVDPDNRRPVDFESLAEALDRPDRPDAATLDLEDGRLKQWMVQACLRARQQAPGLFLDGSYEPIAVSGEGASHVVAYAREQGEHAALVVLRRLPLRESRGGHSGAAAVLTLPARLRGRSFRNVLSGASFAVDDRLEVEALLGDFPVALLISDTSV